MAGERRASRVARRGGRVLVAHGVQKLFGWLGGHGLEGTGAAFEQMGFQPGRQSALAAGLGEAGGGLLIALGLATPAAGAAAAATMLPAATVHAPRGFFATGGGYEYPAVLGVSTAALALSGPGDWSLDARFGHRLNRPWMAAAALLVSPRSRSRSCNVAAGYWPPAPNSRRPPPRTPRTLRRSARSRPSATHDSDRTSRQALLRGGELIGVSADCEVDLAPTRRP